MSEPIIVQKAPYRIEVEAGRTYYWCACGRSRTQPFCDGSHKDSGMTPLEYEAAAAGTVFFCGCKRSAAAPLCDGSHKKL